MSEIGRNAPCPCGSGLKHKRCCLRRDQDAVHHARYAERVWDRMQTWALERFGDELGVALERHMEARGVGTDGHPADDGDLSLALCWLLIDRELDSGGVPARLYSELPALAPAERAMAARIAACRLGLYRVRDAEPGAWIELENVIDARSVRAASPQVSRAAARWHVLLCRVMEGGPMPSLWGGTGFFEPAEEPELLAELRRIAERDDLGTGPAGLEAALRVGAEELVCFVPASRRAERKLYTLEGDPLVLAEATWRLREPMTACAALCATPELVPDDGGREVTFDWLTSRRGLLARRPPLPLGAICLEGGPAAVDEHGELALEDLTSVGTFTLRDDRLEFCGFSEARAAQAAALVERRLGRLAGRPRLRIRSLDDVIDADPGPARDSRRAATRDDEPMLEAQVRELTYRRWIDDPNERLSGLTPRQAASRAEHRQELERQLRGLEHHDARERGDVHPATEVARLRAELGLEAEPLAA